MRKKQAKGDSSLIRLWPRDIGFGVHNTNPIASELSFAVWQKQQAERTPKPAVSRENRDKFPAVTPRLPKPAWFATAKVAEANS